MELTLITDEICKSDVNLVSKHGLTRLGTTGLWIGMNRRW
jgi:hypothetical protein